MIAIQAEIECNQPYCLTIEICENYCINKALFLIILSLNICVEVGYYLR